MRSCTVVQICDPVWENVPTGSKQFLKWINHHSAVSCTSNNEPSILERAIVTLSKKLGSILLVHETNLQKLIKIEVTPINYMYVEDCVCQTKCI